MLRVVRLFNGCCNHLLSFFLSFILEAFWERASNNPQISSDVPSPTKRPHTTDHPRQEREHQQDGVPPHYSKHMSTGYLRSPTRDSFTPEPLALLGHCLALNPHNPDGIRPENRFSRSRRHCPIGKCNTSQKPMEVSRSHIFRGLNSGCDEGVDTPERGA